MTLRLAAGRPLAGTLALALAIVLAVTIAATLVPARRVARADPASAERAAAIWEARLAADSGDFEAAWKLARACYHILKERKPFDVTRCFA